MSKYFDKNFFKFLSGFVAIIAFSLIVILVARAYQDKSKIQTPVVERSSLQGTAANVIQSVSSKP